MNKSAPSLSVRTVQGDVRIVNDRGLHARAAAAFVKCVDRFEADVTVCRADLENSPVVEGRSILGLLTLAAEPGALLHIEAEGVDADDVFRALSELVAQGFYEDAHGTPGASDRA